VNNEEERIWKEWSWPAYRYRIIPHLIADVGEKHFRSVTIVRADRTCSWIQATRGEFRPRQTRQLPRAL